MSNHVLFVFVPCVSTGVSVLQHACGVRDILWGLILSFHRGFWASDLGCQGCIASIFTS